MRNFPANLLIIVGVILILSGFGYGAIFVGVPYQDPTPEISAKYDFHLSAFGTVLVIGFSSLFLGMVGAVAKFMYEKSLKSWETKK